MDSLEFEKLINPDEYHPKDVSDDQLLSAHRITSAWFLLCRQKHDFKFSEEQVTKLHICIIQEMLQRGFIRFWPMESLQQELFMISLHQLSDKDLFRWDELLHEQMGCKQNRDRFVSTHDRVIDEMHQRRIKRPEEHESLYSHKRDSEIVVQHSILHQTKTNDAEALLQDAEQIHEAMKRRGINHSLEDDLDLWTILKSEKYEFSSIQVDLPSPLAKEILDWSKTFIQPAHLYQEDADDSKHGLEDRLHVTVKYGIEDQKASELLLNLLEEEAPILIRLLKTNCFSIDPRYDVVMIEIESEDLAQLNYQITQEMPCVETQGSYRPHITLGYVKKGEGNQYCDNGRFLGKEFIADAIVFSSSNGRERRIHLRGSQKRLFPSGLKQGRTITLQEVLSHFQPFRMRAPAIFLGGGIVANGSSENDIDIMLKLDKEEMNTEFGKLLMWRILRSFPKELWKRIQFIAVGHGPASDYIPLFDIGLIPTVLGNSIIRMSQEPVYADIMAKSQAMLSKQHGISLFRFFTPTKPTRGVLSEEAQTVETFLRTVGEDYPGYVSKKFDGASLEIHWNEQRAKIYSEDGTDRTDRFPAVIEAVKKLKAKSGILLAEFERWEGMKHLPRELMVAYQLEKSKAHDAEAGVIASVFDLVYLDGEDIREIPFEERLKRLKSIGFPQETETPNSKFRLNLIPQHLIKNSRDLNSKLVNISKLEGSEGVVYKPKESFYDLGGSNRTIKYHKVTRIKTFVLDKKDSGRGVYTYDVALDIGKFNMNIENVNGRGNKKFHSIGRTFSTKINVDIGQVILVEYEQITFANKNGNFSFSGVKPRVLEKLNDSPDTIEEALARAKKDGVLTIKEEKGDQVIYKVALAIDSALIQYFHQQLNTQSDSLYILSKEVSKCKLPPDEFDQIEPPEGETRSTAALDFWNKNWQRILIKPGFQRHKFIVHYHFRGLTEEEASNVTANSDLSEVIKFGHSGHHDLRLDYPGEGWWGVTIFSGKTKENAPRQKIEQLKDGLNLQVWPKFVQPGAKGVDEWLRVAESAPQIHGPGEVGSTSDKFAVFFMVDRGMYQIHVANRSFIEISMDGKILKGIYQFRRARGEEQEKSLMENADIDGFLAELFEKQERRFWTMVYKNKQTPFFEEQELEAYQHELRTRGHEFLIWKGELIRLGSQKSQEAAVCQK